MNNLLSRDQIRQHVRLARRSLPSEQQTVDANKLKNRLIELKHVLQAKKIAISLPFDGEINTFPFIQWCWKHNKQVYLPVVHPFTKGHLLFLRYNPDTVMASNQYGIQEPVLNKLNICPIQQLDIIFTPLVAFDNSGNRIGMGGGYYDRMLKPWFKHKEGPYPIGLAHDCQLVEQLPIEAWDVPLPELITPSAHYRW